MDNARGSGPQAAPDRDFRPGWLIAVVIAVCLATVAIVGLLVLEPGFLVALAPGWFTGRTAVGRTLQVVGGVVLVLPVGAAVVAQMRGRSRAATSFMMLALLALVPAAVAISRGTSEVRQANLVDSPDSGACVEYSGGDTTCPGG